jgi:hypothetical protein
MSWLYLATLATWIFASYPRELLLAAVTSLVLLWPWRTRS